MADLSDFGTCTLEPGPAQAGHGCTTCGDVAVPVRVVRIVDDGFALCEDQAGGRAEIATAFTPEAVPGDVLLVHMGVAIAHIENKEVPL